MREIVQRFQTFVTRLRPHRIAILTDLNDKDWQKTCLRIIENLSQIWGGAHSLIIPTDGNIIADVFWEMLSSFDPDVIFRYQKSGYDFSRNEPERFDEHVANEVKKLAEQGYQGDDVEREIRNSILSSFVKDFHVSENLTRQLLVRLSPFHLEDHFQVSFIGGHDRPGYPFTDVSELVKAVEMPPDHVLDVKNDAKSEISLPPTLWLLAESGIASKAFQERLAEKGVQTVPKSFRNDTETDFINWGITPYSDVGYKTPSTLTRLGLKGVRALASRQFETPSVLVVGETLEDFCLYYALSRLHGRTIWLPNWFLPSGQARPTRLMTAVSKLQNIARQVHSTRFAILSTSLDDLTLRELQSIISKNLFSTSVAVENVGDMTFARSLVEHPMLWYVTRNAERITTHLLIDNKLPGTFETPVPAIITELNPYEHRWLAEVTFAEHLTPRHPALGRHLVSGHNVGNVRAATNGATYLCPGAVVLGSDMELQLLRPSIFVPDAETIFRIAFYDAGYECRISDKGAYAEKCVEKFGGLDKTAMALRHGTLGVLLRKFLDKEKPTSGVHDDGDVIEGRRYLNFSCISRILESESFSVRTIDEWIQKEILYRGFIFKCRRCTDVSWFSIKEVSRTFTCRRCGTKQQYTQSSWRYPNEPAWFYKLDEIVYQMLRHDGDVTILSLDVLRSKASTGFLFAPELSIWTKGNTKSEMEIDILCIAEGKMLIGEAKSTASLKSDTKGPAKVANQYRHVIESLGATGAVFATSQTAWDEPSAKAIDDAFRPYPFLDVRRLTHDQLFA